MSKAYRKYLRLMSLGTLYHPALLESDTLPDNMTSTVSLYEALLCDSQGYPYNAWLGDW